MSGKNYLMYRSRASAILTDAYVACPIIENAQDYNQLTLRISFTKGSLTTAEVKVEFSDDGTVYSQETNKSTSGGTNTLTLAENQLSANGIYTYSLPFTSKYVKVSCKGTGTMTNSLMAIQSTLSYV